MAKKKAKAAVKKKRRITSVLRMTTDERSIVAHAVDVLGTEMKRCSIDPTYSRGEQKDYRDTWVQCVEILSRLENSDG
jgi:hypothetical protein